MGIKFYKNRNRRLDSDFFSLVLDAVSLYIDTTWASAILGLLILLFMIWIFGKSSARFVNKIKNREHWRRILESVAISSIFAFVIERVFMPFAKMNLENTLLTLYVIGLFIALPIVVFFIFRKKEIMELLCRLNMFEANQI